MKRYWHKAYCRLLSPEQTCEHGSEQIQGGQFLKSIDVASEKSGFLEGNGGASIWKPEHAVIYNKKMLCQKSQSGLRQNRQCVRCEMNKWPTWECEHDLSAWGAKSLFTTSAPGPHWQCYCLTWICFYCTSSSFLTLSAYI